jgi:CRP-like cAMP-binding protein
MQVLRLPDKAPLAAAHCEPPGWVAPISGGLRLVCPAPVQPVHDAESSANASRQPPPRAILAQLQPGTSFFEHALIDRGNSGIDVFCEGDSTLLLLPPEAFRAALATQAEFSLGVLKWLSLSHHQIGLLKLILTMPMPLRLHAWLDALAHLRGQPDGAWVHVPMTLGQQEIAGWLSTTRQYVAKALNELESSGMLVRRRDAFQLCRDSLPLARPPKASAHC